MPGRGLIVLYILCLWFVISFVTNLIGPLMPVMIEDLRLNLALGGFLPFSFFLAYGIVSIPAGIMVERHGPKRTLLAALLLNLIGALAFATLPYYGVVVAALFIIGLGMAMLQVVINPLMRTAGGEAHFAFFSVLGQLVFGLASFLSPLAFSALMQELAAGGAPANPVVRLLVSAAPAAMPWVSFYCAFAAIFALALLITRAMPIPAIELKPDERSSALSVYLELLRNRHVQLFFLGIVAYVGTEQSLANWMSKFLATYHGVDPTGTGARTVSLFWGSMSVGCVLGLLLLKLLDSRVVLAIFSAFAMACVALALYGDRQAALLAFPAAGFFLSVMFSVIFSLALNSLPRHHGAFSGILCTGILGGGVMPFLVGVLGEWFGLRTAMTLVFLTVAFILSVSFWARPLVGNETWKLTRILGFSKQT